MEGGALTNKCGLCHRTSAVNGVTIYGRFVPICRGCARKVRDMYNRAYAWYDQNAESGLKETLGVATRLGGCLDPSFRLPEPVGK